MCLSKFGCTLAVAAAEAMDYKIPAGYPISALESIQGRRWNMEDAHVNIDDLSEVYKDIPKCTRSHAGSPHAHSTKDVILGNI